MGTRDFAIALNLFACFTPVQSPEWNGISESFVKAFKRGNVRINPLPHALTTLGNIAAWCEDYSESHPRSGLKCAPAGVRQGSFSIAGCPVKQRQFQAET